MATGSLGDGPPRGWYDDRIGRATSDDEVYGYWIFTLGVTLGVLGILLFLPSTSASLLRGLATVFAAAGLDLVFAGPIVRLPLRRRTTHLVYPGLPVCGVAILWFVLAFPQGWNTDTGQPTIVSLYALGLLLMGVGGVFVPLLTTDDEDAAEGTALDAEVGELRGALHDAAADEADLTRVVKNLRTALRKSEADATDLSWMVDRLEGAMADAEADEADLAARLRNLRSSQARFELYEDNAGEFRWRLRGENGRIVADSGEGYADRSSVYDAIDRVKRHAASADIEEANREE